jgi:UDP-glucose 4-epimerase
MNGHTVLLTGATGYIASHTWLALLAAGFDVVGVDDFSNSSPEVVRRIGLLSGREPVFHCADVCDAPALEAVFDQHRIDSAVHFAAFKAVGESEREPLKYYANNVGGMITLLQAMARHGCHDFVFSSSATVYGNPVFLPRIRAACPTT